METSPILYYLFHDKECSLPEQLVEVITLLDELDSLHIKGAASEAAWKEAELKAALDNVATVEDIFACCLIANTQLTNTPLESALNHALTERIAKEAFAVAEMVFFLDRYWLPASTRSIIGAHLRRFIDSVSPDDTKSMEDFQWLLCLVAHDVVTDAKARFNLRGMVHEKVQMLKQLACSHRTANQP